MEHTLEDYNSDISLQATGFFGEHSARAWLYRLKRLIASKGSTPSDPTEEYTHLSLASCGFFVDESSISLGNGLDVLAYPTQTVADELVDRYFKVAHASFPLIGKEVFLSQCRSFYSKSTMQPGVKWMALLNIVFAIAAKHSELMGDQGLIDHNTHIVYFSRAWKLSMNEAVMLEHPNLQQTQIEGLFSLYFLSTGQINRAWRMCGIAIQSAIAMGIQLRSDSLNITHVSKETRYRLWWALYLLDTLLCVATGRMPRMHREHCTTPMPVPYKEESFWDEQVMGVIQDSQARASLVASFLAYNTSNPSGQPDLGLGPLPSPHQQSSPVRKLRANLSPYLIYSIDLSNVMREAIEILYAPEAVRKSALETQQAMKSLNNTAEHWFARLPAAYRFTDPGADNAVARQRTSLAFQYYSTKLVISQPALRFLFSGDDHISPGQNQMGLVCFNTASQMVDLLPSEPNITWLLGYSPWWCILHYLTQSIVVLISHLVIQSTERGNLDSKSLEQVQKVLRWMSELSTRDPAFERAWLIFTEFLSSQGFNVGLT
ncbi:hypothetical protein N7452_001774 [Penicillium brevicompactum]|uniref:Xylanolytic transcriptional activator regulatory domain-containing protein n=1 Tax=Penicillium brevicompactum TaxID=5074 RepID=A0A9W9R4K8_PENBR|nr:hypothetical protein N7452_001774 [Penicillium brevicompactum]